MWAYWKRLYERLRDNIVGNTSQESFVYVSTAILSRLSYTEIVKIAAIKNVSAALKLHQNAFVAGALPRTPLVERYTAGAPHSPPLDATHSLPRY